MRSIFLLVLFTVVAAALGRFFLVLFPVHLSIINNASTLVLTVDNETRVVSLENPLQTVSFPSINPHRREFQIDGSDTTNNFTYDNDYFTKSSTTKYYQFQSLLRDEPSYSTWKDLVIKDQAGRQFRSFDNVPNDKVMFLPQPFFLSVDLFRVEVPRTIEFTDNQANMIRLSISRNDKRVKLVAYDRNNFPRELTSWYFPTNSMPFVAELLYTTGNVIAVALAMIWIGALLAYGIPRKLLTWLRMNQLRSLLSNRRVTTSILCLCLGIVFTAGYFFSAVVFDKSPRVLDSISYYFQGKIFADGQWTVLTPEPQASFKIPFFVSKVGQWFSLFPPGTAMVLAVGFFLHIPWLIETLLAVATTLLIYLIGKKQYNKNVGLLAAGLFATSPFLYIQEASFLSHIPALFFVCGFLYAATYFLETPRTRFALLAGIMLGCTFLIREFTALIYGLAVGVCCIILLYKRYRWRFLPNFAISVVVFIYFIVLYLIIYHYAFTGSLWDIPRHLGDFRDSYGFGENIGFYGQHTLGGGLVNTDELITNLSFYLFGWPFYFGFAAIVLPFFSKRPRLQDIFYGSIIFLFIVVHIGYYYHSIALGPRHYFEAFPAFVFLAARGFFVLHEKITTLLVNAERDLASLRALFGTSLILIVLLLCNALYFVPQQVRIYSRAKTTNDSLKQFPPLHNALVLTNEWWTYNMFFSYKNCPTLDCDIMYAYVPNEETKQTLMRLHPTRNIYEVKRTENHFSLEPITY